MKTVVVLQIDHDEPLPSLSNMVAQRAYTISGVNDVQELDGIGKKVGAALVATMRVRDARREILRRLDDIEEALK